MLHTKFHGNQPDDFVKEDFWRVFTIFGYSGHFGHVTGIISTHFHFHVTNSLHTKFG